MKNKTARWSNSKHRWLALVGGISLLVWGLSGLMHIAMVLFGPQQAQFMPPTAQIELSGAKPIADTLSETGVLATSAVKTVAAPGGDALWQVTEEPMAARRYFKPSDGTEITDGDRAQAEFLARHFLDTDRAIVSATLQTDFDASYPWVNRLLPVWKLEFEGEDRLTAYVHTETSALAAVNNGTKETLQSLFRALHTWEWVPPGMEWLRVLVITLMVGSLFALAATGVMMLVTVRRRKRAPGAKGWHRAMSYILALPLIMFSASGVYHLVQSALVPPDSQLRMGEPVDLASGAWPVEQDWAAISAGRDIAAVSLVEGDGGRALYRVGLAPPRGAMGGGAHDHSASKKAEHEGQEHDHVASNAASPAPGDTPQTDAEIREARFAGIEPKGPAIYLDAQTGEVIEDGDRDIALAIARRFTEAPDEAVTGMELITRFSHEYDFRNKRLPVWRVDYAEPIKASVFVDTASGVLVDRVADWEKPERLIFSMIHKWNFLFPIGRLNLNLVVGGFVIALIVFMAILGLRMDWKNRRVRKRASGKATGQGAPMPDPAE
ncbi:MAG: PepSY domain-containing protein [Erythrobacter sp.]|uniref:PepSY domain-containing protein n=1 Tax=Erythrobacter sp. TaxID=1042 RepID=UPI002630D998|nr:PepSY domain-containing protein [Erythrobacter sp.]MDJ0979005.1 PepSY domain-containing protein [Erythrobacter sp.]